MTAPHNPLRPAPKPLGKSYEPALFEQETYRFWESSGCFESKDRAASGQKSFSIVIPPPNVTGVLHMGHALTNTIQDILTRWHRMKGDNTLWLPGTDHAGIATQAQVEKAIAKEARATGTDGKPSGRPQTRHDLGREAFVKRVWQWKEEHGKEITSQLKRLGSSLDWKRERFTMDEGLSAAVREVFVRLYEEGLIYRGERIINWCPRCQTALSDLEVIPTERKGFFWHLIYRIVDDAGKPVINADGSSAQLVIATTRPETLLGDTAVAVHPDDERYTQLHGKKAVLPLLGRLIPVITDTYVDREFGSGALKVTPAHDFNDYELGRKHDLPTISVMGKDGKITAAGGPFQGLKYVEATVKRADGTTASRVNEARERVLQALKEEGLLVKTEDHSHKVGLCQRCENVAEPIISKQWFVKIEPLAKPAIQAVETGRIQFTPKSWEKTYFEWMYNIRDWCISRQLWWGHQIPAWYCGRCQEIAVARTTPETCPSCKAPASMLTQDEDVLDTWFSSALWPFSTLGWPEKTAALETFYPTSILETGFDIIFFWVARMIMMGLHFMKEVPFHKVYLHAMVRDEKGDKMSKSKGNVIDPVVLIDQHGADPLRFTLAAMAGQGRDIKLSVDRVEDYRAFCNKIWNATKFFHLYFEGSEISPPAEGLGQWIEKNRARLSEPNRWILSRLQKVIPTVWKGLENFELDQSAVGLYEFSWYELCDWYIELSKLPLQEGGAAKTESLYTLHYVLENLMKLMHPFMPFVTEELWRSLPWRESRPASPEFKIETIMLQAYPSPLPALADEPAEQNIAGIRKVIEALRNFRGENGISPKEEFTVRYVAGNPRSSELMKSRLAQLRALSRVGGFEEVVAGTPRGELDAILPLSDPQLELRINLKGLVDVDEEAKRLRKEIEKVDGDLRFVADKLAKESFIARAPAELVEKEKRKQGELAAKRTELEGALSRLSRLGTGGAGQDPARG